MPIISPTSERVNRCLNSAAEHLAHALATPTSLRIIRREIPRQLRRVGDVIGFHNVNTYYIEFVREGGRVGDAIGRICVTGASGLAGRAVVAGLREHGYDVAATDVAATRNDLEAGMLRADLSDYGQAVEAIRGAQAVVHLANIPAPGVAPAAATFNANMTMNFNVFHASARVGVSRVVWASSETTLGLYFGLGPRDMPGLEAEAMPPRYAPVDEDHYPIPTSTYALSKVASETIARHIATWSGIPFIALRISNIMAPTDYEEFPSVWPDPHVRKWNLWGYVDARDVAAACRSALEAPAEAVADSPSVIIAAADTVMDRPSAALLAEVFPGVGLTREIGEFETLLAIDRARQVIGYEPQHSWRDHLCPS
jgi:nucleoside-diphosphate-sugar epimerase